MWFLLCTTFWASSNGNGTECVKVPSQSNPEDLLCNNPVEVGAAFSIATSETTGMQYDVIKASANDGYAVGSVLGFGSTIIFIPSRALLQLFGTY